ncbi:MAG: L,D-transpeptidase family protein [Verrucomicrobiota bacterium]
MGDPLLNRFEKQIPMSCDQLLLVNSANWESTSGELRRFLRDADGDWKEVESIIPVVLGRSGMAWGRGFHLESPIEIPIKQEGDGCSPAGLFELGTCFGRAPDFSANPDLPYRQATQSDYFVDDPESATYNRWVRWNSDGDQGKARNWESAESMLREDDLYEFGIVVRHNMEPVVPAAGSAIFLHVWRNSSHPTAGCTAMSRERLIELLSWLDFSKHPFLLQIPDSEPSLEIGEKE